MNLHMRKEKKLKNKAAMFGLDARVALVIFGTLSFVSGAVLFSVMKKVQTNVLINQVQEVSKAVEAYMMDTHKDIPQSASTSWKVKLIELSDSNVSGWKGPYYSLDNFSNDGTADFDESTTFSLVKFPDEEWPSTGRLWTDGCSSDNCFYWVTLWDLDTDLGHQIDKIIDGEINDNKGRVRAMYPANNKSSSTMHFMWRGPRIIGD